MSLIQQTPGIPESGDNHNNMQPSLYLNQMIKI